MAFRILNCDVLEGLRQLPDESVHCVVTSPPYYRQRDYGIAGQIGLEPTPDEYVARMVAVFSDAKRALRSDGTMWINIGDGFNNRAKVRSSGNQPSLNSFTDDNWSERAAKGGVKMSLTTGGLKEKDLLGVPWMLAFALRADGWYLRQCNIWAKPNCMPESVLDRSTVAHEYVFQFSKSPRYFYDSEAARTSPAPSTETRLAQDVESQAGSLRANGGAKTNGPMKAVGCGDKQRGHTRRHAGLNERWDGMERAGQIAGGANLRSVWWIAPANYDEGHFAVMPDRLAEICIKAGCPKAGTVLDPFSGAGTTCLVADRLQRDAIGIELNPEYAGMAQRRIERDRGGLLDAMELAALPTSAQSGEVNDVE